MKKYFVIILLGTVLAGCNLLNREPHSLVPDTYFNTETELQSFLLGVYSPIMQERFYGNNYPLYISGGDDLTFYQRSTPPTCMMCANTNSGDAYLSDYWKLLYQGINRANMLIENVDRNPAIPAATRKKVWAEALFLRAFYYFHLVQGWGDVPLVLESTKTVEGQDRPRVNKQVIYDRLIADMDTATHYLPEITNIPTPETLSKTAAQGILARVWLFRAGECYRDHETPDETYRQRCFGEARRWALEVYDGGLCTLVHPYSRVFVDYCTDQYNTGGRESLWEVAETGNNSGAEAAAGRIGNVIGLGLGDSEVGIKTHVSEGGLANPGYSYGFAYASLKLYQIYENNGDTARMDWNIAPFTYTTGKVSNVKSVTGRQYYYGKLRPEYVAPAGYTYTEQPQITSEANKTRCAAKYRRELETVLPKNKNYTPINFPILRYSDVLLMLAEAENEVNGPTSLAYTCLNLVRHRADIDDATDGMSKSDMRQAIKDERAMELCFEALRRWDLIRWGDFYMSMREMQGYVNMDGWSGNHQYAYDYYNVGSHYNYFPIPDTEMSLNKAIKTNNPGW